MRVSSAVDPTMRHAMRVVASIPLNACLLVFQGGLRWEEVTPRALVGFALGGLFGAGIGRRWLYVAIERLGPSPATAIKNAAPIVTLLMAIVIVGGLATSTALNLLVLPTLALRWAKWRARGDGGAE